MEPTKSAAPVPGLPGDLDMYTASAVNFQASAWILRIAFGEAANGNSQPGSPVPEVYRHAIGLPWPLAKMVHQLLGLAIDAFEKQEGPISIPKTVQERVTAAVAAANAQK